MKIQIRKFNRSTVAGFLIVFGFTIPVLINPSFSSILNYKNYSGSYDTEESVLNIEFSHDGFYYIVGTSSSLLLFHKSSPTPIWEYNSIRNIYHISITSNGKYFAGGDSDNLYVFSREGSNINLRLVKDFNSFRNIDFSRDGEFFVVTNSKTLYLYSTSTFLPIWTFTSEEYFSKVKISADGSYIVASDGNYLYTFTKFNNISLWRSPIDGFSHRLALSANGEYIVLGEFIVTGKYPKTLYFFNRESPIPIWSRTFGRYITSVAISDDGSIIAAGNSEGLIYLFDSKSSIPIFTYDAPWGIESLTISSNGKSIAAVSTVSYICLQCVGCPCPKSEGELYVFNLESSYSSWRYNMSNYISSGAISSNGRSVLVGSSDKVYYFQNKF
ncbi:MAG: WD40 repeat domain-containing protein [Promethearchaeota archaeon]|jgi:outer membrane protein assembly factor BamB